MATTTTRIYTLSLPDALPIYEHSRTRSTTMSQTADQPSVEQPGDVPPHRYTPALAQRIELAWQEDRKSTRLNSSHANISYAVFCLKKKTDHALTTISTHLYRL